MLFVTEIPYICNWQSHWPIAGQTADLHQKQRKTKVLIVAEHNNLGYWGEQRAAEYLEAKGYGIMARNWRMGARDIDIVAHKDGTVVFVEVKTRRDNRYAEPEQAVDAKKIRSLTTAASAFMKQNRVDADARFDIVTVTGTPGGDCRINHIENAFVPLPY